MQILVSASLLALMMAATAGPKLPAGMARANDPQQVAALDNEQHRQRIEAIRKSAAGERLTEQDAYYLTLVAHRTQLVNEQLLRKLRDQELDLERKARRLADERAAQLERERQREIVASRNEAIHAYQRWLNDEYWREQQLRRVIHQEHASKDCHKPCPQPPQQTMTCGTATHPAEEAPALP